MDYSKETIFHLPGFFEKPVIYQKLLWIYNNERHKFRKNTKIGSIYGAPGNSIWNGGRLVRGAYTRQELENSCIFATDMNIPIRFTFTNCLIENKHLNDTYCNMILDIFNTGKNEIICNSPLLEKYLRNKYGNNYKYISSTTKRLNNKQDQTKEIEKDYYLIVIDYDFNNDNEYLKQLEPKNKIEILCNAVCKSNCPNRKQHYENISRCQLDYNPQGLMMCDDSVKNFYEVMKTKTFISKERIEELTAMGFSNFKLEGRTAHPLDLIEILIYYLIKEEWQNEVRRELQIAAL